MTKNKEIVKQLKQVLTDMVSQLETRLSPKHDYYLVTLAVDKKTFYKIREMIKK